MEKIVIFGGTGMTGEYAVLHALTKGYRVRLLIRNIKTIPESIVGKVELIRGDVTNPDDVEKSIQGTDVVCIVLGTRNNLSATTDLSQGTANIISAMKKYNLKRFSICLSAFLFFDLDEVPKEFIEVNAEHQRMFDIVKASGLEYCAIMPPAITDEPSGKFEINYDKSPGDTISKYDLGKFLIDCLHQESYCCKVCGIATIKE